jgi:hypothetical protein
MNIVKQKIGAIGILALLMLSLVVTGCRSTDPWSGSNKMQQKALAAESNSSSEVYSNRD